MMWLTEDHIGPYSGIVYGKKHDQVEFIKQWGEMVLVENKGKPFHVWPSELTDIEPTKEAKATTEQLIISTAAEAASKKRRRR
jgi:hypothetical protein